MSVRFLALLTALTCMAADLASADVSVYEAEPNNKPADANPISGAVTVLGAMSGSDQDGFLWTVSDNNARKRWTFELQGIPGTLTIVEVVRIHYADNGVDVVRADKLMKMGTRDGSTPSIARDLLFEPGEYLIGIAHAGVKPPRPDNTPDNTPDPGPAFRPLSRSLSFGDDGSPDLTETPPAAEVTSDELGAYRFFIRQGKQLVVNSGQKPRPTRASAHVMRPGNEFVVFESNPASWYQFSFTDKDATQRWHLVGQVPIGRKLNAKLFDADGNEITSTTANDRGQLSFPHFAPDPTTYYVELSADATGFIQAISSTVVGHRVEGEEAEPNDEWRIANRVDFLTDMTMPVTGRSGKKNETDYFVFDVDETTSDQLSSLRIESPTSPQLDFCLLNEDGARLQCERGKTPIGLPDLVLSEGTWGLGVGRAPKDVEYSVTLSRQGPIERGRETEPNDTLQLASGVPANNRIKGRITGAGDDYFRFTIADTPQLWRFQVIGENLTKIDYFDGSGKQAARLRPKPGQRRARLDNLFLLPGQHFVRIAGKPGAEYTLLTRKLGPPDPDGEREPNDDNSRMQRLDVGQTRTGLLADPGDQDHYRYFLGNWDHVRLTIQPPPDGAIDATISWYNGKLFQAQGKAGEALTLSGVFPPGDYHVALAPRKASDAEYSLRLERLPRFSCPADCEPNNGGNLYIASPLPENLVLEGRSGDWGRETDMFVLPVFDVATELLVHSETSRRLSLGTSSATADPLRYDPEAKQYRTTVPPGGPYHLIVDSRGNNYRFVLEFPTVR